MRPPTHTGGDEEPTLHSLLIQCATNITDKVAQGDALPTYGRSKEIDQILTSLASPLKGRIVVTGGPRVGKTSVIVGVAAQIHRGECPEALKGTEVWSLSARSILRAFGVRDWHESLGRLMEQWAKHPEVILYVDALPTTQLAGATADDPYDLAQFLLGQLQSSDNRMLAEGQTNAVQAFLTSYPEYKHVLLEIKISESSVDEAQDIVRRAANDLQEAQSAHVTDGAVDAAIDLTRRFSLSQRLPGKAIDLISESIALSAENGSANPIVTDEDVVRRFGENTGLPSMLLTDAEPYHEDTVRRYFSERVLGQEQAVNVVVQALSLLRTRLNNPHRPMGVFLLIGQTGVGKTELARALSEFLFGSDDHLVRFNMADYTAEWHGELLFGNPHAFSVEGQRGQFATRLLEHSFAVVLLDEFEKAHREIFQRFLQVFDEGVLLNAASESINLRNTIFILTSNFGARMLSEGRLGFGPTVTLEEQEQQIREKMVQFFTPEFINRIDSVSFFKPLTIPVLREIASRRIREVLEREGLTRHEIEVHVDEAVIDWVVERGYSERYGARYLARQIEKTITYPLAQQIIQLDEQTRGRIQMSMESGQVVATLDPFDQSEFVTTDDGVRGPNGRSTRDRQQLRAELPELEARVDEIESSSIVQESRARLSDLMQRMSSPTFWDDLDDVQPQLRRVGQLSSQLEIVDTLRRNVVELRDLMSVPENSSVENLSEAVLRYHYLMRELPFAEEWASSLETTIEQALIAIVPRGSRSEAAKWAEMLATMYRRWGNQMGFDVESYSEIQLLRGLLISITGHNLPVWLAAESGIHRLDQSAPNAPSQRQILQAVVKVITDPSEVEYGGSGRLQDLLKDAVGDGTMRRLYSNISEPYIVDRLMGRLDETVQSILDGDLSRVTVNQ